MLLAGDEGSVTQPRVSLRFSTGCSRWIAVPRVLVMDPWCRLLEVYVLQADDQVWRGEPEDIPACKRRCWWLRVVGCQPPHRASGLPYAGVCVLCGGAAPLPVTG